MKLKASIFASLFVAPLLAAPVTSANTFGIVKVVSSRNATIIAVPWVECGSSGDSGTIPVGSLITNTGLHANDYLYYWGTDGALHFLVFNGTEWTGGNVAAEEGSTAGNPSDSVTRGTAIVLVRSNTDDPFYVYGQVGTTGETFTINNGANVLASPKAEALEIGGSGNWTSNHSYVSNGDTIRIPMANGAMTIYTAKVSGSTVAWKDDKWNDVTNKSIPAGEGFWYVRKAEGDISGINW